MKAYRKKDLHRSKDPDRMAQAVAVVAAYQAIEETTGTTNARLKAQAITDTGAILYALVPVHIGQQCVEKWHALQQRVEAAQQKLTGQELEAWHDEAEQETRPSAQEITKTPQKTLQKHHQTQNYTSPGGYP